MMNDANTHTFKPVLRYAFSLLCIGYEAQRKLMYIERK